MPSPIRVGLISDTHGLLRPQAVEFLQRSDAIIHCGDICDAPIIEALSHIAPVTAVRGNNDRGAWAEALPISESIRIGDILAYIIHDIGEIDIDPVGAGVHVVLSGHSHKSDIVYRDGTIYVNPGSAGPRRFKLPVSIADLVIDGTSIIPRIVELCVNAPA